MKPTLAANKDTQWLLLYRERILLTCPSWTDSHMTWACPKFTDVFLLQILCYPKGNKRAQILCSNILPGATNFGNNKIETLLNLVRLHDPLGTDAWKALCEHHNEIQDGVIMHTWKGLKKKWEDLSNECPPTGDAKASLYHNLALDVKDKLEIISAAETINDKCGDGTIIADADKYSEGKEDAEKEEEGPQDRMEENAEPVGWDLDADQDKDKAEDNTVKDTNIDKMMPLTLSWPRSPAPLEKKTKQPPLAPSPSACTPVKASGMASIKATPPKSTPKAAATPAPKSSTAKGVSVTKATPKSCALGSSKGKEKAIVLSSSSDMINIKSHLEPKKCADPDGQDGGRLAWKKAAYEPKTPTAMPAQGQQQAMDSTAGRLLKAVNPEIAQEAASIKQINTMNNMTIQDQAHKITQLRSKMEQLRCKLNAEHNKVHLEHKKGQAEHENFFCRAGHGFKYDQAQKVVSIGALEQIKSNVKDAEVFLLSGSVNSAQKGGRMRQIPQVL
ncbi:hypothetical protein BDV93DRAFT_510227 [Ceratobasidium sp. AG-I]|nr:hypothetical protein BDV93DRAFT_510227 [Ceratobasidium sp. AG-I]